MKEQTMKIEQQAREIAQIRHEIEHNLPEGWTVEDLYSMEEYNQ